MFDQPVRMRPIQADHVRVVAVSSKQKNKVVQELFAATISMASLQGFIGCV